MEYAILYEYNSLQRITKDLDLICLSKIWQKNLETEICISLAFCMDGTHLSFSHLEYA